ncbi:polyketide synthase [Hypoxylon sp. NC1633]|nr:polyketide synthase [Hypoxylon sp. NC1633]
MPDTKDPIAIVGMACRWPGGVKDPLGFQRLMENGGSGYREFGDHRFSQEAFFRPGPDRPESIAGRGGFLLSEDPRLFDQSFFGISPSEVSTMDPSQRKLLEVVYEAFENAGETWETISGSRTGVFVGNFGCDHLLIQARNSDHSGPYAATGSGLTILSNRVSHIFDLHGPSLTIDTACSSSLYALHLAVSAIRNDDCDSAIVAACNCILDPGFQLTMTSLGVLSPTSMCHTFDASADGYARGEGFAALVITKVSNALSRGLPIRALVRGTAVNANGRTGGITHPSQSGQEEVIRKAYENAGQLDPADTTYFECHGTGTPVGDPVEVSAIANVFIPPRTAAEPLLVGSVKTNLGHTESASALASIMKVVIALENGLIPPTIGVQTANPQINFHDGAIKIVTRTMPWPKGRVRRASINSFGYGGANAHCIIDHVNNLLPPYTTPTLTREFFLPSNGLGSRFQSSIALSREMFDGAKSTSRQLFVLAFSAHNENSLRLNISALNSHTTQSPLRDIAFTLSERRSKFKQRTFRIVDEYNAKDTMDIEEPVFESPQVSPKIAFVFTGQGSQWHAMGSELFQYTVFMRSILRLDDVLQILSTRPSWRLREVLLGVHAPDFINRPEVSQTACTAIQIGLIDLLKSWNVVPSAVMGHSSGEIAAAYAAGRITAADAIVIAYTRGQAVSNHPQKGRMLAVGLGPETIMRYLSGYETRVTVAAVNSPESVTLSGNSQEVDEISQKLDDSSIFNRKLETGGIAYHSHHMRQGAAWYASELVARLEQIRLADGVHDTARDSAVSWISSVNPYQDTRCSRIDEAYWKANLESPVLFSTALSEMIRPGSERQDLIIEIGPHASLKGPVRQILKNLGNLTLYLPSLKRDEDCQNRMLRLAGQLFCSDVPIDLSIVNAIEQLENGELFYLRGRIATDLPPYQYTYGPVNYHESRASKEFRERRVAHHDLFGSQITGTNPFNPQGRNILRLKDLPWLQDHKLHQHPVFPAAGYIALAIESASRAYNQLPAPTFMTGFSLRNLSIHAAMQIPEDKAGIEIITSLEIPSRSNTNAARWMKFSIVTVSQDCDTCTEHCTGLVKPETDEIVVEDRLSTTMDPRNSNERAWYERFKNVGLEYGPSFQSLSSISADPAQCLATAKVSLKTLQEPTKDDSDYPIHPSSLDALFQLAVISCHGGQVEKVQNAFVPVHIDQLYLKNGNDDSFGTAVSSGRLLGLRGAHASLQMKNEAGLVMLDINKLRMVTYADESTTTRASRNSDFSIPFFRLVWKPDIRFMSNQQARKRVPPLQENVEKGYLFDVFERLTTLMLVDMHEQYIKRLDRNPSSDSIRHFSSWIQRRAADDTEWAIEARRLSSPERRKLISQLCGDYGQYADIRIAQRLFQSAEDVLYERTTALDIYAPGGLQAALYESGITMTGAYSQLFRYFDHLGHAEPNLSILEIGAGTGGATRVVLKALAGDGDHVKRYKDYTFTDVSSGFLTAARESLSTRYLDMKYSSLNVEEDPLKQGYVSEYDVIVASQCLHATRSISETLSNCRRLLKEGGKLVIVENIRTPVGHGLVVGPLPGYWNGIAEGRIDSPFIPLDSWRSRLIEAGFSGLDTVLDDYPMPYTIACTIVSTATNGLGSCLQNDTISPTVNIVVCLSQENESNGKSSREWLAQKLAEELRERGVSCRYFSSGVPLTAGSRNIVILEERDLLVGTDGKLFEEFKDLVRISSSMVCVTSCGLMQARHPEGAVVTGLLRTIGSENPHTKFLSIDIDPDEQPLSNDLVKAVIDQESRLQSRTRREREDREFIWQDGCLWVSRLVPDRSIIDFSSKAEIPPARAELRQLDQAVPMRAAFGAPGVLSSLYFKPHDEMSVALPEGWIQVKVSAVGLNWKDLASQSGRIDINTFSMEYAGIVDKVGSAVNNVAVGDRVYGFGKGHLGNYLRAPGKLAQRLQPQDDIRRMATLPIAYMTAIYAFEHITKLKKGEKVLIQSATGGLGLAAIRLARAIGAEIYVTVGTHEKAQHLRTKVGVPADHIIMSKSISHGLINWQTSSQRFDVILSTGSGEMMQESLRLLAPLGRFLDVGRVDVQNSMAMDLEVFQRGATFSSFDIADIVDVNLDLCASLMESVDKYFRDGRIGPIDPMILFDVSEFDTAMLKFSKGTHIGKFVVTYQNPDTMIRQIPAVPRATFSEDAQYVFTGGFGGLGRGIINWMAQRGGCHFTVLSRSGVRQPEAQLLVETLHRRGITVHSVDCDVSNLEDVMKAIKQANATRPIRGIVHAAVSYQDLSFEKLEFPRWKLGLAAKVSGTKNLHEATRTLDLDFFVMITSIETVLALPTQCAYTAANNFQEYFARYRHSHGLPASTISFGLITDVGHLSMDQVTIKMMERNMALGVTEHQLLKLLEPAFFSNEKSLLMHGAGSPSRNANEDLLSSANIITCMDPAEIAAIERDRTADYNKPSWYSDARLSLVMRAIEDANLHWEDQIDRDIKKEGDSATTRLREEFLAGIAAGPSQQSKTENLVAETIVSVVAGMLYSDVSKVEARRSIASYGVDSLIAAELRNWFSRTFDANISMLELLDNQTTISTLASRIVSIARSVGADKVREGQDPDPEKQTGGAGEGERIHT